MEWHVCHAYSWVPQVDAEWLVKEQVCETKLLCKAPVTLYCDPTALARRFEFSQSAVGSHENTEKI